MSAQKLVTVCRRYTFRLSLRTEWPGICEPGGCAALDIAPTEGFPGGRGGAFGRGDRGAVGFLWHLAGSHLGRGVQPVFITGESGPKKKELLILPSREFVN